MNITILAIGTRGDVQPYVALGQGLRAAGHVVTIATSAQFAPMITARGLQHATLGGDFLALLETPAGKKALSGNPIAAYQKVIPMLRGLLDDCWQVSQGADALIYHPKTLGGYHVAEKLGVPGILAHPVPLLSPTAAYPSVLLPWDNLGATLNRASHRVLLSMIYAPHRNMINRWRRQTLGLPPMRNELVRNGRPVPCLYGVSEHVLPQPADWDVTSVMSGFWFLEREAGWQPSAELEAFLAAGPAPVYVGFGSMAAEDAARKAKIVVEALERAGVRGVLATGMGGMALEHAPAHVCVIEGAPHDWLFPQMAAVVHHGGAGTMAAGLRAGKPTVICPFFGDQPFWGRRMAALGVGTLPIPQKQLTVERLSAAIVAVTGDAAMRERAAALGAQIRAEDGVVRAVEFVEQQLAAQAAPAFSLRAA